MYKHIVVPLDGSHNSKLALSEALKLVNQFNAELTLVNVADDKRLIYEVTGTGIANTGGYYKELDEHATAILDEGKKIATDAGVTAKTEVLHGIPKQVIAVEYPENHDVDLIVMGKSRTDAIDRLLVGSTTAAVVRNALTHVLVIAEPTNN